MVASEPRGEIEMSRMSIFALAATALLAISAAVPASAAAQVARLGGFSKFSSAVFATRSQSATRPGSWVMLNPQPLPPRVLRGGAGMFR
jgi:hypothetical protein